MTSLARLLTPASIIFYYNLIIAPHYYCDTDKEAVIYLLCDREGFITRANEAVEQFGAGRCEGQSGRGRAVVHQPSETPGACAQILDGDQAVGRGVSAKVNDG